MNRDSQLRLSFNPLFEDPSHDGIFGLSPMNNQFMKNNFQIEDM
jgi:hypothetical protein